MEGWRCKEYFIKTFVSEMKSMLNILKLSCWATLKNSTILITGATGFLGYYLTEVLLEANAALNLNNSIIICARNFDKAYSLFQHRIKQKNVRLVLGDLCEEIIIPIHKIDYIIHAAMPSDAKNVKDHPGEVIRSAIKGTETILSLAEKHNTRSIVYVSSVTVYGKTENVAYIDEEFVGEQDWKNGSDSYMLGKRVAEHLMLSEAAAQNITIKIVRPGFIFGANPMPDSRVYNNLIEKAARQEAIELLSDGSLTRPLVYVMDVVKAIFMMLDDEESGCYNVTSGECSLLKYAKMVADYSKSEFKVKKSGDNQNLSINKVDYSTRKIQHKYNWKVTNMNEAIREAINIKREGVMVYI